MAKDEIDNSEIAPHVRLLSESLRLAREHGSTVTLDEEFGKDVEAGIESHRKPLEPPSWE